MKSQLLPEASSLRPRFIVRDAFMGVGAAGLALLWAGLGGTLVKRQILADNYLSAAIIFGPSLVLMLVTFRRKNDVTKMPAVGAGTRT